MEERANWSQIVERQIAEAVRRGDFDNLPGAGRPLDLAENPFVPPDLRMAFHLLKSGSCAPEWIELDKEIRIELDRCQRHVAGHRVWLARMLEDLPARTLREPPELQAPVMRRKIAGLRSGHHRFLIQQRIRLDDLNRLIERFNWLVPVERLRRQPLPFDPAWDSMLDDLIRERGER